MGPRSQEAPGTHFGLVSSGPNPVLPFLGFFENGEENHQKNKDFYPYRTPKIPGKDGKKRSKKQGNPRKGKKQGIPKKQGKEGQGRAQMTLAAGKRFRNQTTKNMFFSTGCMDETPTFGFGSAFHELEEIFFCLEPSLQAG